MRPVQLQHSLVSCLLWMPWPPPLFLSPPHFSFIERSLFGGLAKTSTSVRICHCLLSETVLASPFPVPSSPPYGCHLFPFPPDKSVFFPLRRPHSVYTQQGFYWEVARLQGQKSGRNLLYIVFRFKNYSFRQSPKVGGIHSLVPFCTLVKIASLDRALVNIC